MVKMFFFVAGRGTGKSSKGMGTVLRNIIHFLPKSKGMIVAESYRSMLENTLPSTFKALEDYGYYRNVHYVVGIEPPKHWDTPYEPTIRGYKNTITFWNGTTILLISQDSSATSPRGLNTDWCIVDEALNLDKDHFDEEIMPTIRANQSQFKHVPFHLGVFFFSSMPYGINAEWLTKNIEYYLEDGIDQEKMMAELISLQMDFLEESNINHQERIWKAINDHRKKIDWYPKKVGRTNTLYVESNAFDNIRILGYDYIYKLYKTTSTIRFMTEIMNKRMNKPEGGFYAKFDRAKHTYKRSPFDKTQGVTDADKLMEAAGASINLKMVKSLNSMYDNDCIVSEPLQLGVDFGGNINTAVVGQDLPQFNMFNFIKDFYVKSPEDIDDLAHKICEYYKYHQNRLIYFYYDRFGNQVVGNSKVTYAEQFADILIKADFTVIKKTSGANPLHMKKYMLWSTILDGGKGAPVVQWNYYNCIDSIISIEGCGLRETGNEWKKDKTKEGKNLETEEKQPHLSDATDYVIFPLFTPRIGKRLEFSKTQTR